MRRSGVRASPGANILAAMFAWLDICVFRLFCTTPVAQSVSAFRTYKSVQTEKCEGREFEPPLEQMFSPQCLPG